MKYSDFWNIPSKKNKNVKKVASKPKVNKVLNEVKKELNEWNSDEFKNLPKRWSGAYSRKDGLTEFEASGGKDSVKEELLTEQMSLRSMYYELGDKIENLGWMLKRFKPIKGDNIIHQVHKQMSRELDRLYKHLNKTYKNWD